MGGAERVVDILHEMFPNSPVYTLVFDEKNRQKYQGWDIRTTWLNAVYRLVPHIKFLLPLIPFAAESLDLRAYDLVISSSSGFIRNIKLKVGAKHISFCHSPTRFLWIEKEYIKQEVPYILRPVAKVFINWMQKWDLNGVKKIDFLIANSKEVQNRIKKFYNRDSVVIYPSINFDFWATGGDSEIRNRTYFLLAGRLQAHKKNDLIIEIFNDLKIPLHIAGSGRQEKYLRLIAKDNIKFLGKISDEELKTQYRGAKALIYPQLEDFGLMPLEAGAAGTPTLAYGLGGALETVIEGVTGEFFRTYDKESIKQKILNWDSEKYLIQNLQKQAKKFETEVFKKRILEILKNF